MRLTTTILVLFTTATVFAAKFILLGGVDLGVTYGKSDVVSSSTYDMKNGTPPTTTKSKFSAQSYGASIGPHIGVETCITDTLFMGIEFGGVIETTRSNTNYDNENHRFIRNSTLSFMPRVGAHATPQWDLFINGGIIYMNGYYAYADTAGMKYNKNVNLPGWTVGGGTRYALSENTMIGLRYAFESFKAYDLKEEKSENHPLLGGHILTQDLKFTPRYHKIILGLDYKI